MTVAYLMTGGAKERLRELPDNSVHLCVTSPPYYGLRNYSVDGQIGHEKTPKAYIAALVEVFREVRRVLRSDGSCWAVIGDCYAGSWGNQGRKEERGTQRPINADMIQNVVDGRYPSKGSNTGKIPPTGRMRLKKNLTQEQKSYVLSELAKASAMRSITQDGLP